MDDLISRQAAIEVIDAVFPVDPMKTEYAQGIACGAALAKTYVEQLPSAQPEPCEYCNEDSDGYVKPVEKNGHVAVLYSPIYGWILGVKYGAWRKDIPIQFCPMCGRRLKNG